jgi:hypothetical protein
VRLRARMRECGCILARARVRECGRVLARARVRVCMFVCVCPRVRARVHAHCALTLNIEPVVLAVVAASVA